jgi:hypothetical protein
MRTSVRVIHLLSDLCYTILGGGGGGNCPHMPGHVREVITGLRTCEFCLVILYCHQAMPVSPASAYVQCSLVVDDRPYGDTMLDCRQ